LDVTAIVAIVTIFGAPIAGGLVYAWMKMRLRHHEIELQQQKLAAEQQLRTDELNAKILKMDDFGLSPVEIASLAEDVRRLREEVAQLRQEITNRTAG